ncbi:hypothetical protein [Desulfovibrio gilichinskyi]|uniref:Uncharacterized protein n=1 Tax=Desulfovibrio gilichinskyi TaxID=1519643 RepID=A0A1X7DRS4_9BACT|nr:hypothetical protein [Desulfovibrio gilichinskyi]SMF20357.1 hypothetical protein SAMN06295933_2252 [Desulfovibrio gilichinskyi]
MKKILLLSIALLIFMANSSFAANAPNSIAGITLGQNLSSIRSILDLDSARSPWQEEYIKRIEVKDLEGYNGGYIVVGDCNRKDIILRFKLKYADGSSDFFDKIYSMLEKRFGKPNDWRGNPFGTLKVWKWSLNDDLGNISLILQHFSGDDDSINTGNSIRLSRPEWIEQEQDCWEKANPVAKTNPIPAKMKGMSWFIPY